jgi:hypothetical protein
VVGARLDEPRALGFRGRIGRPQGFDLRQAVVAFPSSAPPAWACAFAQSVQLVGPSVN